MALEDLLRYESAAVAAANADEKDKTLAVLAMKMLNSSILGKDAEESAIFKRSY